MKYRKTPSPDALELSRLLRSVAEKDPTAMETLYVVCRKRLFSVAYSVTRDIRHAEDVLQETMMYVWKHASDYRIDTNPYGWISMIARHIGFDLLKKRRDSLSVEMYDIHQLPKELTSNLNEEDISIRMGLDRLEEIEAQVFVLKAVTGYTHAEIANMTGLSTRSVRYRYRCAIEKLRIYLNV